MKIAVGTKNPVKIAAVEAVIERIWPGADVVSIDVPSGVSIQPMSDEEAIVGATNRAKLSLEKMDADYGIGLEGCGIDTKHGMFLSGWVVVIDRNGKIGTGSGGRILLPQKIAAEVRRGRELGPVMDEFSGGHNTKQKEGAVGILTNGLVMRKDAFEGSLVYALARFLNEGWYG